jgi:CO/xanthine dehydrogenase Mo-binding subunit
MGAPMTVTAAETPPAVLPPLLKDNPRLDQWVRFETPGRVTVSTGRVEIGQGVLTAMLQIAADELDVSPDRIDLRTGDTTLTPDEGYTAGSHSIQFGGIAMRLVVSGNQRSWYDNSNAYRLGYQPEDDSESQAAQVLSAEAGQPKNPIAEKYQGGTFPAEEYDAATERK